MTVNECKLLIANGSIIPVTDENLADVLSTVAETLRRLNEENYFSATGAACRATYSLRSLLLTKLSDNSFVFESRFCLRLSNLIHQIPKLNLGFCMADMTKEELRNLISITPSIMQLGENDVFAMINTYINL